MVKVVDPILPSQIALGKKKYIPGEVIECVNTLVSKHWNGSKANFSKDEIIEAISKATALSRREILDLKYLDFEEIYRAVGWKAEYIQGTVDDDRDLSYFSFSKKPNKIEI